MIVMLADMVVCVQQNPNPNHEDIIWHATECKLTAFGNATYMQLQLTLAQATNKKTQLKGLKCLLDEKVICLQMQLQTIE